MKLKLIAASMSMLGLVSCPILAATDATSSQASSSQATQKTIVHHHHHVHHVVHTHKHTHKMTTHKVHHVHHAHHHHHATVAETALVTHEDYKAMGTLPSAPTCMADHAQPILDEMNHNTGRAMPSDLCKPIAISGGIAFDAHAGNRSLGYTGENNQRFSLNDAYLNVHGVANDWTTGFLSASYSSFNDPSVSLQKPGTYSSAYESHRLNLEQGFLTFRNASVTPFFLQVGKQFEDFGRYTIHPITRSMTQVLSETLRTSANFGFVTDMGLHGSLFTFDNPLKKVTNGVQQGHTKLNFGGSLGYDQISDQLGWDAGVGYLYNMTGVNDVEEIVAANNPVGGYQSRVGAVSLHGDVNTGPFSLGARYVTALQRFNMTDLAKNATQGAKPWAAGIQAGYSYNAMEKNQNIYVGYQASRQAATLYLPRSRWVVGYGIDVWKNTGVGLEWNHDRDYRVNDLGTGNNSNTLALRIASQFG